MKYICGKAKRKEDDKNKSQGIVIFVEEAEECTQVW